MTQEEIQGQIIDFKNFSENEMNNVNREYSELKELFKEHKILFQNLNKFYDFRQSLVIKKRSIKSKIIDHQILISTNTKIHLDSYKFGKKPSPTNQAVGVQPKNDMERTIYLDSDMKIEKQLMAFYENHLEFIEFTLKGVDNMVYGFETVLEYVKNKSSF
jgi:hypothetical protein